MSRKQYNKIDYYEDSEINSLLGRLRDGISLLFEYEIDNSSQWTPNSEEDFRKSNIEERKNIVMDIAAALNVPFDYEGDSDGKN